MLATAKIYAAEGKHLDFASDVKGSFSQVFFSSHRSMLEPGDLSRLARNARPALPIAPSQHYGPPPRRLLKARAEVSAEGCDAWIEERARVRSLP